MSWISKQWELLESAYQAGHWAELLGNWLVIGGLSIAILAWTVIAAMRLRAGVRRFCRAIDQASAHLATTPATAGEFAGSYKIAAEVFERATIIGPAWRAWSATIITPAMSGAPVRSTSRPNTYFSIDILRDCGVSLRLQAAMPNLLVGIGLFLTFIGLAVTLSSAGGIADPSLSPPLRQVGFKTLLDVASVKFVTSVVGLFCSLAYTVFRGRELDRAQGMLDGFLAALEERIPLATPATLQAESNEILEKFLAAQSTLRNDLAISSVEVRGNASIKALEDRILPLREAIEKLSEGIGTRSEDALRTLLGEFRSMLQGSARTHMEMLAEALARTSEGMEQMRAGLTEAAGRMASSADEIAEHMGRKAEQAVARITLQAEALVGELRTLAEQSRSVGNDAMGEAARRIADAGNSFDDTARAIAASLEQTILSTTARVSGEAEAATRRMTEELANAIVAMREFAEQNRSARDEATRTMAGLVGEAAAGFERSAAQVAEALAEAARAAASALKAGGQESGDALRSGGAEASRELQVATGGLAGPAQELGQGIMALRSEVLELQKSLESTRQASIEATTALRTAASDLVEVVDFGQETTTDPEIVPHGRLQGDDKLDDAHTFFDALKKAMKS